MARYSKYHLYGLCQLLILATCYSQHKSGDQCQDVFGNKGICKSFRGCDTAKETLKRGVPPTPCSILQSDHVVCCTKQEETRKLIPSNAASVKEADGVENSTSIKVEGEEPVKNRVKFFKAISHPDEGVADMKERREIEDVINKSNVTEGTANQTDKTTDESEKFPKKEINLNEIHRMGFPLPTFEEDKILTSSYPFMDYSRSLMQWPLHRICIFGSFGLTSFGNLCDYKNIPEGFTDELEYDSWI